VFASFSILQITLRRRGCRFAFSTRDRVCRTLRSPGSSFVQLAVTFLHVLKSSHVVTFCFN